MSYLGNSPGVASQRVESAFTATSNQTVFTPTSGYTLGYCDVYQNGVKLVNGDDYTAADGATVTLTTGAATGDSIVIVASFPRGLSDGYLKSEADAKYVALTGDQTVAGVKTLSSNPILSGGTANGIAYLNGSKVVTSGSALVFDGTNLGLGVTPSAWGSIFRAFQIGNSDPAFIAARTDGPPQVHVGVNAFYDGTNWKYINTDYASRYYQSVGTHVWETAASGSAGGTVSFTQAMTLDASGRLLVGTTSSPSSSNLRAVFQSPNASGNGGIQLAYNDAGGGGGAVFSNGAGLNFYTYTGVIGSETYTSRASIDSSGNLGLGVTPVSWVSGKKAVEVGYAAHGIASFGTNDARVVSNIYYDGAYKYGANGYGAMYLCGSATGSHAWYTAANNTNGAGGSVSQLTQQLALDASGNLSPAGNLVLASGKGIDFSATANSSGSMGSELLDDYEVGTWTPVMSTDGGGHSVTHTVQRGTYSKIGRVVTVSWYVGWSAFTGGSNGVRITNLPFTVQSTGPGVYYTGANAEHGPSISYPAGLTTLTYEVAQGNTSVLPVLNGSAAGTVGLTRSYVGTGNGYLIGSVTYDAA